MMSKKESKKMLKKRIGELERKEYLTNFKEAQAAYVSNCIDNTIEIIGIDYDLSKIDGDILLLAAGENTPVALYNLATKQIEQLLS